MMELLWYGYRFSGRHDHEISVFEPVPPGETLYLTKKPPDTLRIHRIFRADDNLHVIAMLRDPRAVITSMHEYKPDVYFSSYWRWKEYLSAVKPLLDHPRFALIRFEDLVSNPDEVQQKIEDKFGFLIRHRDFQNFPEGANVPGKDAAASLNGIRSVDTGRIVGWKEHLPRIKGQLREYPSLPQDLIDTGYEKDDLWLEALAGIDYYTQEYKDRPPSPWRAFEANLRFWLKTRRYLKRLQSQQINGR